MQDSHCTLMINDNATIVFLVENGDENLEIELVGVGLPGLAIANATQGIEVYTRIGINEFLMRVTEGDDGLVGKADGGGKTAEVVVCFHNCCCLFAARTGNIRMLWPSSEAV